MRTIRTVVVVGVGLIGGSVGLALKRRFGARVRVTGVGRDLPRLRRAVRRGAVDRVTTDIADGVKHADLVVVCTPVETIVEHIDRLAPHISRSTVITDVGSVKKPVLDGVRVLRRSYPGLRFVGSHPVAGSERSGIGNSQADLFDGAWCAVCSDGAAADRGAVRLVLSFWRMLGARVVRMTAAAHDRMLAATSHAPHLLSYALSRAMHRGRERPLLTGGAYRDMTRIAGSNPALWSWICWMNRGWVRKELERVLRELGILRRRLGNRPALEKYLVSAMPPESVGYR